MKMILNHIIKKQKLKKQLFFNSTIVDSCLF